MTLSLIEGAVDAVYDYLQSNIASKITEINNRYKDFDLQSIRSWHLGEPSSEVITPGILVVGLNSGIGGEGDNWMEIAHRVMIAIIYSNPKTDTLRLSLYRYVLAFVELVRAMRASSGYAVTLQDIEYSEIYGKGDQYLSDARLIIQLASFES